MNRRTFVAGIAVALAACSSSSIERTQSALSGEAAGGADPGAGFSGRWTLLDEGAPEPRKSPAVAWDSDRKVVVMHGGSVTISGVSAPRSDTWEWDGVTRKWSRSPGSGPTNTGTMAYDPARKVVVQVSGSGTTPETWEYPTATRIWARVFPATTPGPHSTAVLFRDPGDTSGTVPPRLVLYTSLTTGSYPNISTAVKFWTYSQEDWSELASGPVVGDLRPGSATAWVFDSTRRRLVAVGGSCASNPCGNSAIWDAASATWSAPYVAPSGALTAAGYDPVRKTVTLAGSGTLWDLGSGDWTNTVTSNLTVKSGVLTHDGVGLVCVGGEGNSIPALSRGVLSGSLMTWTDVTGRPPPGPRGLARVRSTAEWIVTLDPERNYKTKASALGEPWALFRAPSYLANYVPRHVASSRTSDAVFGAFDFNASGGHYLKTWNASAMSWSTAKDEVVWGALEPESGVAVAQWGTEAVTVTGWAVAPFTSWTNIGGPQPAYRRWPTIGVEPSTKRVFVFGGLDNLGNSYSDTWAFDPTTKTWTELAPGAAIPKVLWRQLMTDYTHQRMVLYGGSSWSGTRDGSTWIWDPQTSDWTPLPIAAGPTPGARSHHAGMYDDTLGLVISGGLAAGEVPLSDTWRLELIANPGPDAGTPGPDAAQPGPDAAQPGADAAQPGPDAAQPGADAAESAPDAGRPDAAQPGPDASLQPEPDAAEALADSGPAGPDAAEATDGATGLPDTGNATEGQAFACACSASTKGNAGALVPALVLTLLALARPRRRSAAALAVVAVLAGAGSAGAAQSKGNSEDVTRAKVQTYLDLAGKLFAAKDYEGALAELTRAEKMADLAVIRFNVARCLEELQRPLDAMKAFDRYVLLPDTTAGSADRKRRAEESSARLAKTLGALKVTCDTPGAQVYVVSEGVESQPIPCPLERERVVPGRYDVRVVAEGRAPFSIGVAVPAGATAEVEARLAPLPAPGPRIADVPAPPPPAQPVKTDPGDDVRDEPAVTASAQSVGPWSLGLKYEVIPPPWSFGASLTLHTAWRLGPVDVGLGGRFFQKYAGPLARVAWRPGESGRLRGIVAFEPQLLFAAPWGTNFFPNEAKPDGTGLAFTLLAGGEYQVTPWLGLGIEVSAMVVATGPDSLPRFVMFAGPAITVRP